MGASLSQILLRNEDMNRKEFGTGYNKESENSRGHVVYIEENGKRYPIPYKTLKLVEFSNLDKTELIDQEHSARLQYRLLLLDAVIKAYVEFQNAKITIIYNPLEADNIKEKINLDELIKFLDGEGIKINKEYLKERDYDYYKEFYLYTFNPKTVRESTPYGTTLEQWRKEKPKWEKKLQKVSEKKLNDFYEYQKKYEKLHPEVYKAD